MGKQDKKNTGKAPSVQFYIKDWLADMRGHGPEIVGAWALVFFQILHENKQGSITGDIKHFALLMHTNEGKAQEFIDYFAAKDIANVVTRKGRITVTNRRAKRDAKLKRQNRLRQQRFRDKRKGNGDVAPVYPNPSSSSSSSTSVITTTYTQQQVLDAACLVGVHTTKATGFFDHYNAQGWVFGNGQPITNLQSALNRWKKHQYKFEGTYGQPAKSQRTGPPQAGSREGRPPGEPGTQFIR